MQNLLILFKSSTLTQNVMRTTKNISRNEFFNIVNLLTHSMEQSTMLFLI